MRLMPEMPTGGAVMITGGLGALWLAAVGLLVRMCRLRSGTIMLCTLGPAAVTAAGVLVVKVLGVVGPLGASLWFTGCCTCLGFVVSARRSKWGGIARMLSVWCFRLASIQLFLAVSMLQLGRPVDRAESLASMCLRYDSRVLDAAMPLFIVCSCLLAEEIRPCRSICCR